MHHNRKILLISLFIFLSYKSYNQEIKPNYFIHPLKIDLILSGTFAELRSNHFHSGIDIKTQGTIGHEVVACADGYVSRIKISATGYGKAIYIHHPSGHTTVYAHLDRFTPYIDSIVRAEHYRRQNFEIDFFPDKNNIPLKQGDVIAYSGNSGSSGGPHLHFEIRDVFEHPLNPLDFGIKTADAIRPEIKSVRFYSNYSSDFKEVIINSNQQNSTFPDTLNLENEFYIGINTIDKGDNAQNQNGVYSIQILFDSVLIWEVLADKIDFSLQRYINAYIDYKAYYIENKRFIISKILPGNKLNIYERFDNKGVFNVSDSLPHQIEIVVSDYSGNTTFQKFVIIKSKGSSSRAERVSYNFKYNQINKISIPEAKLTMPVGCLYQDVNLNIYSLPNTYTKYSSLVSVGSPEIPLQTYYAISIKVADSTPSNLGSKLCVMSFDKPGNISFEGGVYKSGWMNLKSRSFGTYYIDIDTIAPVITPENIPLDSVIMKNNILTFKITDNLSGIQRYNAFVGSEWVLGEYDAKTGTLTYKIDDYWKNGIIDFKLVVNDKLLNKSVYQTTLKLQ